MKIPKLPRKPEGLSSAHYKSTRFSQMSADGKVPLGDFVLGFSAGVTVKTTILLETQSVPPRYSFEVPLGVLLEPGLQAYLIKFVETA